MFKVGEVVTLKSGGLLRMTVAEVGAQAIKCHWSGGKGELKVGTFDALELIKAEDATIKRVIVDL